VFALVGKEPEQTTPKWLYGRTVAAGVWDAG
jgi:hypothetical protein